MVRFLKNDLIRAKAEGPFPFPEISGINQVVWGKNFQEEFRPE